MEKQIRYQIFGRDRFHLLHQRCFANNIFVDCELRTCKAFAARTARRVSEVLRPLDTLEDTCAHAPQNLLVTCHMLHRQKFGQAPLTSMNSMSEERLVPGTTCNQAVRLTAIRHIRALVSFMRAKALGQHQAGTLETCSCKSGSATARMRFNMPKPVTPIFSGPTEAKKRRNTRAKVHDRGRAGVAPPSARESLAPTRAVLSAT